MSPKAKRVRLEMSQEKGLIVVVPKRFDAAKLPAILIKKRNWIQKIADRLREKFKLVRLEAVPPSPERIALAAISEEWRVDYQPTEAQSVSLSEHPDSRLVLSGAVHHKPAVQQMLRRWVAYKARKHLVPWGYRLARERNLEVARFSIRSQKTRWGSCSSKKSISLNLRLLFMSEQVARYVLLHELAHTQQMNHSERFWAVVAKWEPDYKRLRTELRHADQRIPLWFDERRGMSSLL